MKIGVQRCIFYAVLTEGTRLQELDYNTNLIILNNNQTIKHQCVSRRIKFVMCIALHHNDLWKAFQKGLHR